jgi:hypothetical protein
MRLNKLKFSAVGGEIVRAAMALVQFAGSIYANRSGAQGSVAGA